MKFRSNTSWRAVLTTCVLSGGILLNLWRPCESGAAVKYAVTDLGDLGGPGTFAYSINNLGQVTGYSSVAPTNNAPYHAFLWTEGVMQDLGALDASGNPDPTVYSQGKSVNDKGQVVGLLGNGSGGSFLWQDGVMTKLVTDPPRGQAFAINNSGHIVGWNSSTNPAWRQGEAFLWTNGNSIPLGAPPGSVGSQAYAINNYDQIVGGPYDAGNSFLYSNGTMTLFPETGGAALAINDRGQIAGYTHLTAFLWYQGTVTYLTNATMWMTVAYGINSQGHVVGVGNNGAFLYRDGTIFNLNELVSPDSGCLLESAYAINDSGQIVANGSHYGSGNNWPARGFLLTPIPTLTVQNTGESVILSWPKSAVGFKLAAATDVTGASTIWNLIDSTPTLVGEDLLVTVPKGGSKQFYRLQKP